VVTRAQHIGDDIHADGADDALPRVDSITDSASRSVVSGCTVGAPGVAEAGSMAPSPASSWRSIQPIGCSRPSTSSA
jgi:hypothetical protein